MAHPQFSYGAVFLVALTEAVPVVGSVIPGSTMILSISALIATGDLTLIGVLVAAVAGAALGDGSAYWLGRRYPDTIRQVWPLNRYPEVVRRSEAFFRSHGSSAVFLGRFLPPVRAFVPVTAGALGMAPQRFFPINIVAILLWAPVHVLPGVLAGAAYKRAGVMAEHLLLPIAIGVIAIGLVIWAVRASK